MKYLTYRKLYELMLEEFTNEQLETPVTIETDGVEHMLTLKVENGRPTFIRVFPD